MPFLFAIIGLLLIVVGFQNTYKQFGTLVAGDFTGTNNFIYWIISIILLGSIGYIKPLQTLSRALLVAILVGLIFRKGNANIFNSVLGQIQSGTATTDTTIGANVAGSPTSGSSSQSSSGGLFGSGISANDVGQAAEIASAFA
jgi:hypothetical protein